MNPPSIDTISGWLSGGAVALLGVYVPKLMQIRRQHSRDAAERAEDAARISKSGAEADYFEKAIGEVVLDRDKWKETASEAWALVRKLEAQVARFNALQEMHEHDVRERDRQIDKLWKLVLRFAPAGVKEALEVEYEHTKPAPLDGPTLKGRR